MSRRLTMREACYRCRHLHLSGDGFPMCTNWSGGEAHPALVFTATGSGGCAGQVPTPFPVMAGRRYCPSCRTVKPDTDFYRDVRKRSGKDTYCRECRQLINAEALTRREEAELK